MAYDGGIVADLAMSEERRLPIVDLPMAARKGRQSGDDRGKSARAKKKRVNIMHMQAGCHAKAPCLKGSGPDHPRQRPRSILGVCRGAVQLPVPRPRGWSSEQVYWRFTVVLRLALSTGTNL